MTDSGMQTKDVKILALKYADSYLPESMVFPGGNKAVNVPITFCAYLLEMQDALVLVDPGCDTMPEFEMRNYERPVDVLKRFGYRPEDVTDIIVTHAHYDHIEATHHYTNAVIHIQELEYEDGKAYIPEAAQVRLFSTETTVANCLKVKYIGGHTKGSSVVELEKNGQIYVIAGDECYVMKCLQEKIPTGKTCCPEKSLRFVQQYGGGKYTVLLSHDPEIRAGYIDL